MVEGTCGFLGKERVLISVIEGLDFVCTFVPVHVLEKCDWYCYFVVGHRAIAAWHSSKRYCTRRLSLWGNFPSIL